MLSLLSLLGFSLSLSVGLIARMSSSSLAPVYVTLTFSVFGFVATFVFYILTAKCNCCKQYSCPEESLLEKCCGTISCTERETEEEQQSPSCCSSSVRAKGLTILQLCAKLLLVLANIVLLSTVIDFSHVTVICAAWELVVIFLVAVVRECCWLYRVLRKYEEPNLWGFLEYLRFGDLQITSFLVPFGNVSLFQGDLWWLVVGIIRLGFYVITFITDVVNGVRSDCCCSVSSGHGNNPKEIKNKSYVVTRIVMKLIEIGLKLVISSSAFAVFLFEIAGLLSATAGLSLATGIAYIIFTLLSGHTAFVSLWFSAIAIRWEVVQKGDNTPQVEDGTEMRETSDDQDDDREDNASPSCCAGVIDCLKKRQPHVHAIFVLDIITFVGLIVLNMLIVAIKSAAV